MVHLSVWDQRPGDGPGGTADTVLRWRAQGHQVSVIDLEELLLQHQPLFANRNPVTPDKPIPTKGIIRGSDLVAIFFADARGFSRLSEPDLPRFVEHFLGLIARQIDALPQSDQPLKRNTWGDPVSRAPGRPRRPPAGTQHQRQASRDRAGMSTTCR